MNQTNSAPSQEVTTIGNNFQLDVLAILQRRKMSILIALLCGLGIGVCYKLFWPAKYESSAEIMLIMNNSGAMASSSGSNPKDLSDELLATHIQIIQSPRIVAKALGLDIVSMSVPVSITTPSIDAAIEPVDSNPVESVPASMTNPSTNTATEPADPASAESGPASMTTPPTDAAIEPLDSTPPESLPAPMTTPSTDAATEPVDSIAAELGQEIPQPIPRLVDLPSIQSHIDEKVTPIRYVIDNLYVTSGGEGKAKDAHSLKIQFRHTDPADAQLIVASLIKEYEQFVREKFQDVNGEAARLITDARSELEGELSDLSERYQKFRAEVPLLASSTQGGNIYQQRYEELAAQLSKLLLAYDEAEGRLNTVKSALNSITGTSPAASLEKLALIDSENVQRMGIMVTVERGEAATAAFMAKQPERVAGATTEFSSLLKAKSDLSRLRADYGDNHPDVLALSTEIKETEEFLGKKSEALQVTDGESKLTPDDVMAAYVKMLENDLVAMKKRQSDIQTQMTESEKQAKALVVYELQNETMVRERDHREALYDSVLERLREINMQSASSSIIHEVLDEPQVGEQVEPSTLIAALLAILSSGLIATGLIGIGELRDSGIHDPTELEAIMNSKIIAHVPTFSNEIETWPQIKKLQLTNPQIDSTLVVHHFPKSRLSEVFRATRTQLAFAVKGDHKSIAFTSANEGDGKSTLVANIAISIAQTGRSVVLIDCDLRRPNTFRIFGVKNDHRGLSDALENNVDVESLLEDCQIPNLKLLASGHVSDSPAETLTRREFREMVENLKKKFDFVILDCPPLLPVSDPSIIATVVDAVVFVAKINQHSRPQAKRCMNILDGVGVGVSAIIVNRADEALGSYGYQTYGYESTYGKSYYSTKT